MTRPSLKSAIAAIPEDIRNALTKEYRELESRFARRDWHPAQLNGGRFAEALLRYLQWKSFGSFTPIGKQLNRSHLLATVRQDASLPDGIRFLASSAAGFLMDLRNKRDVAHLGPAIDVKAMDAHLVMRLASWSLSEIVREESGLKGQEAQLLIDKLSERRLALVEEINGNLVVVATKLGAAERSLVALYHRYPHAIHISKLRVAVQYANPSRFRTILSKQAKEGLLFIEGDNCQLTAKGSAWVEKHIGMHLEV